LRRAAVPLALAAAALLAGCRQDMHDQPKWEPLEATTFFEDGRSSRPVIPETVARGRLHEDAATYTGKLSGKPVESFPFRLSRDDLARGRDRYEVYCSPCHGRVGDGNGMVVLRGFRRPPSFHDERLRQAPPGHYFDVMTNGFGAMSDYASQVGAEDRWRITAYIRALQLSQRATIGEVPAEEAAKLAAAPE
jgi:mono/diheme cytochrome c family protein